MVFCSQYYKQVEVFNSENKTTSHRCTTFRGSGAEQILNLERWTVIYTREIVVGMAVP